MGYSGPSSPLGSALSSCSIVQRFSSMSAVAKDKCCPLEQTRTFQVSNYSCICQGWNVDSRPSEIRCRLPGEGVFGRASSPILRCPAAHSFFLHQSIPSLQDQLFGSVAELELKRNHDSRSCPFRVCCCSVLMRSSDYVALRSATRSHMAPQPRAATAEHPAGTGNGGRGPRAASLCSCSRLAQAYGQKIERIERTGTCACSA